MKKTLIFAVAAGFFLASGLAGVSLAETDKGPETMTINPEGKKPAVNFPHRAHQERLKCGECHHGKGEDGKQVPYQEGQKIEKCVTCHTGDMLKGKVKGKSAIQHRNRGNCLACHKDEAKKDPKKKSLKKCSTCHPKKKKK